jgi:hypothetical protein
MRSVELQPRAVPLIERRTVALLASIALVFVVCFGIGRMSESATKLANANSSRALTPLSARAGIPASLSFAPPIPLLAGAPASPAAARSNPAARIAVRSSAPASQASVAALVHPSASGPSVSPSLSSSRSSSPSPAPAEPRVSVRRPPPAPRSAPSTVGGGGVFDSSN